TLLPPAARPLAATAARLVPLPATPPRLRKMLRNRRLSPLLPKARRPDLDVAFRAILPAQLRTEHIRVCFASRDRLFVFWSCRSRAVDTIRRLTPGARRWQQLRLEESRPPTLSRPA